MKAFIVIFNFLLIFGTTQAQIVSIEVCDTCITKVTSNLNGATTFIELNICDFIIEDTIFLINKVGLIEGYHSCMAVTDFSKKFFLDVLYPEECPTFVLEEKDRKFFDRNSLYIGGYKVEFLILFRTKEERALFKKEMKKTKRNRLFNTKKPRSRKASP